MPMTSPSNGPVGTVALSFPVARKLYRCSSCNGSIAKGDRYRRWTGRSDLWIGLATEKRCRECCDRYGDEWPNAR